MSIENIVTKWMVYEDIKPYKEQLVKMEYELIKKYHYPDREISESYPKSRVEALEEYLKSGRTFFWGAVSEEGLIGYYWAYISDFLGKPRWNLRSLMIDSRYQHMGLGRIAMNEGLKKAKECGCYDTTTEYVPSNTAAEELYRKMGYVVSRIEIVKKI